MASFFFHIFALIKHAYASKTEIGKIRTSPKMAPMMVIAACMPDELNYEYRSQDGKYYGSLSYALSLEIQNSASLNYYARSSENILRNLIRAA